MKSSDITVKFIRENYDVVALKQEKASLKYVKELNFNSGITNITKLEFLANIEEELEGIDVVQECKYAYNDGSTYEGYINTVIKETEDEVIKRLIKQERAFLKKANIEEKERKLLAELKAKYESIE